MNVPLAMIIPEAVKNKRDGKLYEYHLLGLCALLFRSDESNGKAVQVFNLGVMKLAT